MLSTSSEPAPPFYDPEHGGGISGMTNLNVKAFGGLLLLLLVMAMLLFVPAWTLNNGRAWAFLAVFGGAALVITLYLMKKDKKLLERRVYAGPSAEKERSQQIIQSITAVGFGAGLVVASLDYRMHWSRVPLSVVVAGDLLVAVGFLIVFFVYRENSFASATIKLAPDQKVISTGPYALVRHPMYFGGLVMFVGIPLALGSWWGLLVFALMVPAIIWRLLDEEKFLENNLMGYSDYRARVTYRLIPFVW
jgi:protein-S-isoprenylcysteine O-methyltransferase Ste14